MRVVIISGIFYPEIGGPSRYLYGLSRHLQEMGHSIEVVTFGESDNSLVDPCPTRRISRKLPLPLRVAAMGKAIWKASRGTELLFVNDYGLPAVLVNTLLKKPMVMKIVGDFAWEVSTRRGWIKDDIDTFQNKRYQARVMALKALRDYYVRKSDHIVVPSHYLKKMVTGWGADSGRIQVIHNALDPKLCGIKKDRTSLPVQTPGDGLTILTVARLAPWKGVDELLHVVSRLPSFVRLLVVGDGPERPRLESLAVHLGLDERVQFEGTVPLNEVQSYYEASDIFVLFSGYEGFSHALLEACHAGLAIVASDRGGNPELIENRRNGLLVAWPETKELERALVELVSDGDLRAGLGEAAKATIDRFSWESLLSNTTSLLETAVQEKR